MSVKSNTPNRRVEPLEVCNPEAVRTALAAGASASAETVRELLYKADSLAGLTPEEVAVLLQVQAPGLREEIIEAGRKVHQKRYGRRVRLSAPVCPSNRCVDDCLYCPLRRSNTRLRRNASTSRELQRDILSLLDEGHRYIALVFGDDRSGVPYVRDMISASFGARSGSRQVQRLDLNVNPVKPEDLPQLHLSSRFGAYHVFQETYDPETYTALHPSGPKADYEARLLCHDRALQAGLPEVGLGVLLGAYDFRFDVVALMGHLQHLQTTYHSRAYAITYPRMIPVAGAPASQGPERQISDEDFIFVVATTRLAAPALDIILSTPAPSDVRRRLYACGASQVSVGTASYPGVYTADGDPSAAGGLSIGRPRALEDLVYRMAEVGFIPNLCVTSAAEVKRTPAGEFSVIERDGANALLALKEYVMDYASPETRLIGERLIQSELAKLPKKLRDMTLDLMEEAEAGFRGQVL